MTDDEHRYRFAESEVEILEGSLAAYVVGLIRTGFDIEYHPALYLWNRIRHRRGRGSVGRFSKYLGYRGDELEAALLDSVALLPPPKALKKPPRASGRRRV